MIITKDTPVFAEPRISEFAFAEALRKRNSPAKYEVNTIWPILIESGVDPSVALAQFWAESQYGTAGWARITTSWGNILFPNTTITESVEYKANNGYRYASYENFTDAVRDYVGLMKKYRDIQSPTYGDTSKVYWATAKWIGMKAGSEHHTDYLDWMEWRMNQYEDPSTTRAGERMINAGLEGITTKRRYLLKTGTPFHEVPGEEPYGSYTGKDTKVRYIGRVNYTGWGAIVVKTAHGSPDKVMRDQVVYVKNVRDSDIV